MSDSNIFYNSCLNFKTVLIFFCYIRRQAGFDRRWCWFHWRDGFFLCFHFFFFFLLSFCHFITKGLSYIQCGLTLLQIIDTYAVYGRKYHCVSDLLCLQFNQISPVEENSLSQNCSIIQQSSFSYCALPSVHNANNILQL